jgi:NADPH-dependent 2,4-dienoyl-CoA reductase/sulfur reductase-like enzyme/rhodanese-related sulfurtransferase
MHNKKIVIIGGVAGGANAAARLRRLDESLTITILERGPHISFANCGLPYYVGGEIAAEEDLLLHTPESLGRRFNLTVRTHTEAYQIDRSSKKVLTKNLLSGALSEEHYDDLIIATGGAPIQPPIEGIDHQHVYRVRNVPDVVAIKKAITEHHMKRAVVVGGGYIGLEMVEQLAHAGIAVTLVQSQPQVLGPLDSEMATLVHQELTHHGVTLLLSDSVVSIAEGNGERRVLTKQGKTIATDLVVVAIGVLPESSLARAAGLTLGKSGGITVNEYLQTSDPAIWAIGDCIEVKDLVTGTYRPIPLAGPANRQGRAVADSIAGKKKRAYHGSLGTAVLRVFSLTIAVTGANERTLRSAQIPYQALYLHPNSHAGYYPGASPISMKVLYSRDTEKLLGVQAIGKDGVEKRVDVLATAIKSGLTIDEIADLELCYAPPYGSAKDPVNMIGMMAQNLRDNLVQNLSWEALATLDSSYQLLDVRDADECARGSITGALMIPLSELRARLHELPQDKKIVAYCQSGQRSYNACRILAQNGFTCFNLSGAYKTYRMRSV